MTTSFIHGKEKVYEETFISPANQLTKGDALKVLNSIRSCHPESSGWVEIDGFVEQLPNGSWRAIRHHVQYR